MADNKNENGVPGRPACRRELQRCGAGLDSRGRSEACCPSAELAVRPHVRCLDGTASRVLAARQGQALLRAVAALEKLDEEGQ